MNTSSTTTVSPAAFAILGVYLVVFGVLAIIMIFAMWRLFKKAGRPGWYSIIPFYNSYALVEVAQQPGWLFALFFIPFVGTIAACYVMFMLGKAFGKSDGFCVGLILLSPIFLCILAFGSSEYGASVATASVANPYVIPGNRGYVPPVKDYVTNLAAESSPAPDTQWSGTESPASGGSRVYADSSSVQPPTNPATPPSPSFVLAPGWYPYRGDQTHIQYWDGHAYIAESRWNGTEWVSESAQ